MSNDNPFGSPAASEGNEEDFSIDLPAEDLNRFRIDAGKYAVKLIGLDKATSEAGNPMWIWTFVLLLTKFAGREFRVYTALTPAAMWKLRETVEGLGLGKGGALLQFKKAEALGKLAWANIVDTTYKGKGNSSIETVTPMSAEEQKAVLEEAEKSANAAAKKDDIPF